jgi:hypothetical protein
VFYNIVPGPIRQWLVLIAICKKYMFLRLLQFDPCVTVCQQYFSSHHFKSGKGWVTKEEKDIALTLNINPIEKPTVCRLDNNLD